MRTRSQMPVIVFHLAVVCSAWPASAQTDARGLRVESARRIALVIGNDAYSGMPLKNAVNDARAIEQVLREIGFQTRLKENATKVVLERAVDDFVASLGSGDVGLFYYAGHGIEIERENYLVPVDFNGKTRADAKYEAYAARRVLDKMQESGAKFRMMILDACRNNPFSGRGSGAGLAKMDAATGEFIAFATAPNKTASDNPGANNGLFTSHLISALRQPGLRVQDLFDRVRAEVYEVSNHGQIPYAENGVIGDFYPNPRISTNADAAVPDTPRPVASSPAGGSTTPPQAPPTPPKKSGKGVLIGLGATAVAAGVAVVARGGGGGGGGGSGPAAAPATPATPVPTPAPTRTESFMGVVGDGETPYHDNYYVVTVSASGTLTATVGLTKTRPPRANAVGEWDVWVAIYPGRRDYGNGTGTDWVNRSGIDMTSVDTGNVTVRGAVAPGDYTVRVFCLLANGGFQARFSLTVEHP